MTKIFFNAPTLFGQKINTHAGELSIGKDGWIEVENDVALSLVDNTTFFLEKPAAADTVVAPIKEFFEQGEDVSMDFVAGQAYIFDGGFDADRKLDLRKVLRPGKHYKLDETNGGLIEIISNENEKNVILTLEDDGDLLGKVLDLFPDESLGEIANRFEILVGQVTKPSTLRTLIKRKLLPAQWKELLTQLIESSNEENEDDDKEDVSVDDNQQQEGSGGEAEDDEKSIKTPVAPKKEEKPKVKGEAGASKNTEKGAKTDKTK